MGAFLQFPQRMHTESPLPRKSNQNERVIRSEAFQKELARVAEQVIESF